MSYKYTLIVSQYYHSRHMFIVHHKEDFLEKAKKFTAELMKYKRDADCKREMDLGDLDYIQDSKIRRRYNVNDSGDIYFIQSNSVNYCMEECKEYHEMSIRENRGFQSKKVTNGITEHHNYHTIRSIVEKYFEIA